MFWGVKIMGRTPSRPSSFADYTVWPVVSKYVRLRGCLDTTGTITHGHCYTCARKSIPFAELEAGHCIPQYGHASIRFEPDNIRPQCNTCNDYKRGSGMRATFEANLRRDIGNERVDRLVILGRPVKHWTIEELQFVRKTFQDKIDKILEANK
jgi:hypothetical protein